MHTAARRLVLTLLFLVPTLAYAAGASPVGTWRTFDDADGKENGTVTIIDSNGVLYGSVSGITDPARANAVCTACTDDRAGKKVIGLQIIRGLKPDGAEWDGGEILDPKSGKAYRCSLRLEDGGNKLLVHGYIGISLIGRTQTWVRK